MPTPRDKLVSDVAAVVDPVEFRVLPYARSIDAPELLTVLVRLDEIAPNDQHQSARDYTFGLILVATHAEPGRADDELDAGVELLLAALDESDTAVWTKAQRATYQDTDFPAYEITVSQVLRPL